MGRLPRRVLDRTWHDLAFKSAKNDTNLAPQNDPKSTKNRCQKTIKILIDKKTFPPIHFGRPGGMRWPPGGIIGGAINLLFELCRYLKAYYGFKMWRFGLWLRRLEIGPARPAPPLRCGRRIQSLRAFRPTYTSITDAFINDHLIWGLLRLGASCLGAIRQAVFLSNC